jgi:hypothetical protein
MLIIDVPASVRGFISAAGEFGHAKSGMKGPLGNDRSKPAPPDQTGAKRPEPEPIDTLEAGGAIRLIAFPAAR